jgi:hypothetical protein
MSDRLIDSKLLGELFDVEATLGRTLARRRPALAAYVLETLQARKAERREKCETARLIREARWREIASGERPALSLAEVPGDFAKRGRRAA